ncbi:MAG TPA: hypothetical protein DDW52_29605, partial [Planctomycetaceae bacterium]|nr:hypothetical protein [Planctomycetaceae bacterium]
MNLDALYASINDATNRNYPHVSLVELIGQNSEKTPETIAVLCDDARLTYAELDQRSEAVANYLFSLGVRNGDLVGLCCDRYIDTPVLLLGILKCGAGYVPLDPEYPVDRLAYMVENSQLKHIVANTNQVELTNQFEAPVTVIDQRWDEAFAAPPREIPHQNPSEDVAYVIYTSGSTGLPKGVVVQHAAVVNLLLSMSEQPGFSADDRILATTT